MIYHTSSLIYWLKSIMTCLHHVSYLKMGETMTNQKLNGIKVNSTKLMQWLQPAKIKGLKKWKSLRNKWLNYKQTLRLNLMTNTSTIFRSYLQKTVSEKLMVNQEDLHRKDLDLRWQNVKKLKRVLIKYWTNLKSSAIMLLKTMEMTLILAQKNNHSQFK